MRHKFGISHYRIFDFTIFYHKKLLLPWWVYGGGLPCRFPLLLPQTEYSGFSWAFSLGKIPKASSPTRLRLRPKLALLSVLVRSAGSRYDPSAVRRMSAPPMYRPAPRQVFTGPQAETGRKIPAIFVLFVVSGVSHQRRGRQQTYARYRHQPLAAFMALAPCVKTLFVFLYPGVQFHQFAIEFPPIIPCRSTQNIFQVLHKNGDQPSHLGEALTEMGLAWLESASLFTVN